VSNDWEMPRRGEACVACGRDFKPGDMIRAYLYESPEGYERRDHCADCRPPDEPPAIGVWRTRRPEPAVKRVHSFDREAVYHFFRRLEDADTPEQRQLRFVLALLLWRKRVLKLDRSDAVDGAELWHFTVPRSEETHAVERPDLDEEQLERLSTQLEALLAGEVGELSATALDSNGEQNDA
jgi:hypothetical protein